MTDKVQKRFDDLVSSYRQESDGDKLTGEGVFILQEIAGLQYLIEHLVDTINQMQNLGIKK